MREAGGAVVDPILLERLGLKVGDPIAIGKAEVIVRGTMRPSPTTSSTGSHTGRA